MYQYPVNVPGVSVSPKQTEPQADAPAPREIEKNTQNVTSPANTKPEATDRSGSTERGFFYKEVSHARRAQAQMIATGPKPPPLNWKLAIERLSEAVGQMERAMDLAQSTSLGAPAATLQLAALPSDGALRQADRLSAFYLNAQIAKGQRPAEDTAAQRQEAIPAEQQQLVQADSAAEAPNLFVERAEKRAELTELRQEQLLESLRQVQSSVDAGAISPAPKT